MPDCVFPFHANAADLPYPVRYSLFLRMFLARMYHAKQGNDTFEIAQDLELPYEVVSEILNMAERRKYSYKEIAADAQVAEATVYNYHKRMLARENLSI